MTEQGQPRWFSGMLLGEEFGEQRRVPQDYSGGKPEGYLGMRHWWGQHRGLLPWRRRNPQGLSWGVGEEQESRREFVRTLHLERGHGMPVSNPRPLEALGGCCLSPKGV